MKPRYAERIVQARRPVSCIWSTSKTGRDGSIAIHQDADLWLAKLAPDKPGDAYTRAGRHAWVHVAEGEVSSTARTLLGGDAAAIDNEAAIELVGAKPSQVLLFDLN